MKEIATPATTPATQPSNIASFMTTVVPEAGPSIQRCQHCVSRSFCEVSSLIRSLDSHQNMTLFRPHGIAKHQHVFYAGDKLTTLYVVKSGLFKTYLSTETGEEQVMGFHMPGNVLGADGLAHHYHSLSTMALEASSVCAVAITKLEAVAARYQPQWLIEQVYQEVLRERRILQITGRKYSTDARVAFFLLDIAARNKARGYSEREFKLNMPRRDIAHYLDMALETVSRVFTRLQDRGIVEVNRPYITIHQPEELQALTEMAPLPENSKHDYRR